MGSSGGKIFLIGIVAILTLVIGQWAATDVMMAVVAQLAIVAVVIVVLLGRYIWLIIPFSYSFIGSINVLPGSFTVRDLSVMFVAPVLIMIWTARRFNIRFKFGLLEAALVLQFIMIGQAFIRNPVGLSIFGGDVVGGRDYFEMAIALLAFIILSSQVVSVRYVKFSVWALLIGSMLSSLLNAIAGLIPGIGYRLAPFYSTMGTKSAVLGVQNSQQAVTNSEEVGRLKYMRALGENLITCSAAKTNPLGLLKPSNFVWLLVVLVGLVCALYSGYRSSIVWAGLVIIASAWIQKSFKDIIILFVMGVPILAALLIMQGSVIELPMPAQRALSFLPADWNHMAVSHAQDSSEWRFIMWQEVLFTDEYIYNKFLGDGFGFSATELSYQQAMMDVAMTPELLQEYFMRIGKYHSGPIETIRRVGYVGLIALLFGMAVIFREAKNTARIALMGPMRFEVLFVTLPLLVFPVFFVFVAGSYTTAIVTMCFMSGMLRLIQNAEAE